MTEYIERDKLWDTFAATPFYDNADKDEIVLPIIDGFPAADAVVVVRCKDCIHSRELTKSEKLYLDEGVLVCANVNFTEDGWNSVWPDDFCPYGKRRKYANS